jgi:hypothetical protein
MKNFIVYSLLSIVLEKNNTRYDLIQEQKEGATKKM